MYLEEMLSLHRVLLLCFALQYNDNSLDHLSISLVHVKRRGDNTLFPSIVLPV